MDPRAALVSSEVSEALRRGAPVVALESAVITQGLPYPHNLDAARRQSQAVRAAGAVPATVAVLRGRIRVGLQDDEIAQLADGAAKASVRDLACLMAEGGDAGTTVSATVAVAARVGIPILSTGGIGGVHRDAGLTFDVSADLHELARQRVAVVCSGVKNLLDVRATLELLETLGVPVVGLGTREMPGFLARELGIPLEHSVADPGAAARLLTLQWEVLRRNEGLVFAHPIPAEYGLDGKALQEATDRAVEQCAAAGIRGKALTPFVLKRIEKLTAGKSLPANLALLEHNASRAGELAVAYAGLAAERDNSAS